MNIEDSLFDCINQKMEFERNKEKMEKENAKIREKQKKRLIEDIKLYFGKLNAGQYDFLTRLGMMRVTRHSGFWASMLYTDLTYIEINPNASQKNKIWYNHEKRTLEVYELEQLQQIDLEGCIYQLAEEKGCIKKGRFEKE